MKFLTLVFIAMTFFSVAQAEDHKSMICEKGEYKITTYQSMTAQNEVVVLVQKNELGVYSNIYSFYYEAAPVEAWIFTEVQNPENSVAVVATSEKEALANIKIDLGKEGLLKVFNADCILDVFANN